MHVWLHLYKMSRIGKFIEIKRSVDARGRGKGKMGMTANRQFLLWVTKVNMGRCNPHGHSNNNWPWKVIITNASSDYSLVQNNEWHWKKVNFKLQQKVVTTGLPPPTSTQLQNAIKCQNTQFHILIDFTHGKQCLTFQFFQLNVSEKNNLKIANQNTIGYAIYNKFNDIFPYEVPNKWCIFLTT